MIEHELVAFSTYNDQACVACLSLENKGGVDAALFRGILDFRSLLLSDFFI
jgi:hypothetical protein